MIKNVNLNGLSFFMAEPRLVSEVPASEHHELKDTWVFWYLIPNLSKSEDWSNYLKQVGEFHSVEDFWGIMNSVDRPMTLVTGCRYYIFKKGVKPLWEDEGNKDGYQIFCPCPVEAGAEGRKIAQEKWEDLAASVLGAGFTGYEYINGVEFNCRKRATNVGIWTKEMDSETLERVKETVKGKIGDTYDVESTKIELK